MKETPSLHRRSAQNSLSPEANTSKSMGKSMAPPAFQLKAGSGAQSASVPTTQAQQGEYKKTRFWRKWQPNEADLFAALAKFPKGQWALEVWQQAQQETDDHPFASKLIFDPGSGSMFDLVNIHIGTDDLTIERACEIFIHEVNHLNYSMSSDPVRAGECHDRYKYMQSVFEQEAEGDTLLYESVAEMEAAGMKVSKLKRDAGYKAFQKTYKLSLKKAMATGKSLAKAKESAREAAKAELILRYSHGDFTGSTDGQAYNRRASNFWAVQHPEADAAGNFPTPMAEGKCVVDRSKIPIPPPK